jgi:AcrR family transcriptional regulator
MDNQATQPPATRKPRSRQKFEQKREEIINAATDFINSQGTKGTTLLEVARMVDLNTTSITYYFKRKELLAAAVFERTMERLHAMVTEAGAMETPQDRVRHFINMHMALRADVIRGKHRQLASLSDLRSLEDEVREPLERRYQDIFRDVRAFFIGAGPAVQKEVLTARAHMLLETVFWLPVWTSHYPLDEFDRVSRRLFDILERGIACPDAVWQPLLLTDVQDEDAGAEGSAENFLRVATRLINESGYRGASVLRIVEELKVTKGSFYHHLDAKDDLVLECFRRSYRRIAKIQAAARTLGDCEWQRLTSVIASLLDIQFDAEWPLTRTSALQALPANLRSEAVVRSDRSAVRFAGNLIEAAAEGSVRVIDPMIASQMIIATLNSAFDLRNWASRLDRSDAIGIYASTVLGGLFATDVAQRWTGTPLRKA